MSPCTPEARGRLHARGVRTLQPPIVGAMKPLIVKAMMRAKITRDSMKATDALEGGRDGATLTQTATEGGEADGERHGEAVDRALATVGLGASGEDDGGGEEDEQEGGELGDVAGHGVFLKAARSAGDGVLMRRGALRDECGAERCES